MKKKMMILAVLFLAVVVTGFSVSGTYAKYISAVDVTDEARVAKWQLQYKDKYGVTDVTEATTTQEIDLFKESYTFNGKTYAESLSNGNIVAPGLKGEYTFELGGVFETRFTLDLALVEDESYNTVKLSNGYDPLRFQVETYYGASKWVTYDELKYELEDAFKNAGKLREIEPGEYGDKTYRESVTIRWAWAYDEIDAKVINSLKDCDDEFDTLLGNKAANGDALDVKLTIKATATQVQDPDYIN